MQSPVGTPTHQGGGNNSELALTGSQVSVTRRPSSAGSAKQFSRSVSVITESQSKGNSPGNSSRAINNLRRSNSTTQVTPGNSSLFSGEQPDDLLAFFESSSSGRRKLGALAKTSPEKKTTWNVLDEHPRVFPIPSSARSANSVQSSGMKRRDAPALAPSFPANNRSSKGTVGNTVTTMVHNNYSSGERSLNAKSSNQRLSSLNNQRSLTCEDLGGSFQKSQKNLSSTSNLGRNNTGGGTPQKRREVTAEEAERFIQQVNTAAVTIQRWYRRHRLKQKSGEDSLRHILASKKEEREQHAEEGNLFVSQQAKADERRRIREEKARQARRAAIQELQQKRAQKAVDAKRVAEEEVQKLVESGKLGRKKTSRNSGPSPLGGSTKANNTVKYFLQWLWCYEAIGAVSLVLLHLLISGVFGRTGSLRGITSWNKLYSTSFYNCYDKLTINLPCFSENKTGSYIHFSHKKHTRAYFQDPHLPLPVIFSPPSLPALLSEEELTHLEQASAVATEVTSSMLKLRLEVDEKKKTVNLLQTALAQQRELTIRHVKQTEKELGRQLKQQSEQYEATIQRHLSFIDQLIDDKKALSEKCESLVNELKQVDQKYGNKINQMQEHHDLEMKKLQDLMSAAEKVRREKWIDEKTKKIKEITVKGLEPEIQRLIAKHKQEIRKLKALHEAELLQSDERAAQRYVRQAEELRHNLDREKEELAQRERELAKQRYEKQLVQEEQSLQEQRRRLYSDVSEEKERLNQQAARQRTELDELRRQLEENCALTTRVLKEEYDKGKEEQERRHQAEIKALKERLEIEKQAWEQNYMKKEEAWLLSRERELKEDVRKGRDKDIELVIQRLESEMSTAREECERAAENRIKRVRDKYESELQELERSERKLQERCNQLKERATELEGEQIRLQGLLKQREQEVEDIRKITDRLTEERKSLSDVIRQEFADRLVLIEEENRRLKIESSESQARHRLELERINRDKEEELEEVHKRVKTALVKKEETMNSLRKQREVRIPRTVRV
ncbi:centrosomal of 131 kDa isoform X1 [Pelobates cultripes]|uniref:Centrosomal of 131 kDa isoform X1 n=1 Tax=Pelobates cultripes TaxID=61616 RepID=A0AAD1S327_PELCU|nr:centrosomal of 131 kDa isoform X1 [Pelobates cultripes]